jgi:hypothetical protein
VADMERSDISHLIDRQNLTEMRDKKRISPANFPLQELISMVCPGILTKQAAITVACFWGR